MTNVITVQATLTGDASSMVKALQNAQDALTGVSSKAAEVGAKGTSAVSSFMSGLASLATKAVAAGAAVLTIGAGAALKAGLDRVNAIDDATAALTISLGSSEKAADLVGKALQVVQGTPYAFPQFAKATQTLLAFGESADKIPATLTAIGDAAAAAGGDTNQSVSVLTDAFSKLQSQGRLTGQVIESFQLAGVNATGMIANGLGLTTEAAQKLISAGLVPSAQATDILMAGIENGSDGAGGHFAALAGQAKALGDTLSGSIENLSTAFARMGASAIQPLAEQIPKLINGALIPVLDALGAEWTNLTTKLADSGFIDKLTAKIQTIIPAIQGIATGTGPIIDAFEKIATVGAPVFAAIGGSLLPLLQNIPLIGSAFEGLTGPIGIVIGLFGAMTSASPELRGSLVKALSEITDALAPLGGLLKPLADAFSSVAGAAGGILASALDVLLPPILDLVTTALPPLADLLIALLPLVGAAADIVGGALTTAFSALAPVIESLSPAVSGVLDFLGQYGDVVGTIVSVIGGAVIAFEAIKVAMAAYAVVIDVVKLASLAWTAVQIALDTALDANPISIIIIAIAALVAGIIYLATQTTFFQDAWSTMVVIFNNTVGMFQDFVGSTVSMFVDFFDNTIGMFSDWVSNTNGMINDFVSNTIGMFADFFSNTVGMFADFGANTIGMIVDAWNGFLAWLGAFWQSVGYAIGAALVMIVGLFTGQNTVIVDTMTNMWNAVLAGVESFIGGIQGMIGDIVSWVTSTWNNFWAELPAAVSAMWSDAQNIVAGGVAAVQNFISSAIAWVIAFWNSSWNLIGQTISQAWSNITSFVSNGVNQVISFISNLPGQVMNFIHSAFDSISGLVSNAFSSAVSAVSNGVSTIISTISSLPGKIQGFFSDAGSWLLDAGSNIVNGLIQGVKSMVGGLVTTVQNMAQSAISAATNFLGIKSPSTVFRDQVGKMIGAGLINGIDASVSGVNDAMNKLVALPDLPNIAINSASNRLANPSYLQGDTSAAGGQAQNVVVAQQNSQGGGSAPAEVHVVIQATVLSQDVIDQITTEIIQKVRFALGGGQ